jgi:hypothetical protein
MKKLIFAMCLLLAARVSADDLRLAKETFGKFAEYQKNDDPRILDLVAADCSGRIVQSDGTLEIVTLVSPGRFRQGIEAALKKKEGNPDPYEEVEYQAHKDSVSVSGVIKSVKTDFKGPFQMTLKKDEAGTMKIRYAMITFPLGSTPIKSHDLFEFVMPGEWKITAAKKADIGEERTVYSGGASSNSGSLGYTAFEDGKTKPENHDLKEFPWAAAGPLLKKLKQEGGKEKPPVIGELTPGNKDQVYFIYPVEGPDKEVMRIHGIVIRTDARIYTIFAAGTANVNKDLWLAVAKSFKEL